MIKFKNTYVLNIYILLNLLSCNFAYADCSETGYILKDQKNNIYQISSMKECYHYYDKDTDKTFPKNKNKCYLEEEINHLIDKLHTKHDIRGIGERLIEIIYQGKPLYITEELVIGSPFLDYEVNSSIKIDDYKSFRPSNMKYGLYDREKSIDFTDNGTLGEPYAKESYVSLYGKIMSYSKCN